MELLNNQLSTLMGQHYTKKTIMTLASALSFLYTLKKKVEEELKGFRREERLQEERREEGEESGKREYGEEKEEEGG